MALRVKLEKIGNSLIEDFINEFIAQGHNNTGAFIDSMELQVNFESKGIELLILWEQYGSAVNKGRKAGTKKIPIQALVQWVQQRGIERNNRKALSVAFAIQKAIFVQGSPTRGAFQYSSTGKRTGWVETVLEQKQKFIEQQLELVFFTEVQATVEQIAEKSIEEFKKLEV